MVKNFAKKFTLTPALYSSSKNTDSGDYTETRMASCSRYTFQALKFMQCIYFHNFMRCIYFYEFIYFPSFQVLNAFGFINSFHLTSYMSYLRFIIRIRLRILKKLSNTPNMLLIFSNTLAKSELSNIRAILRLNHTISGREKSTLK